MKNDLENDKCNYYNGYYFGTNKKNNQIEKFKKSLNKTIDINKSRKIIQMPIKILHNKNFESTTKTFEYLINYRKSNLNKKNNGKYLFQCLHDKLQYNIKNKRNNKIELFDDLNNNKSNGIKFRNYIKFPRSINIKNKSNDIDSFFIK